MRGSIVVFAAVLWSAFATWWSSVSSSDSGAVHAAALASAALVFARDRSSAPPSRRLRIAAWCLLAAYALAVPFAPRSVALLLGFAALALRLVASTREPRNGAGLCVLFVAALPFAELAQAFLGVPLRVAAASLAAFTLRFAGLEVERVGVALSDGRSLLFVDPACGGLRFAWSGLWLAGLFAASLRLRAGATVLLVLAAGISAVLANAMRTSSLYWVERASSLAALGDAAHAGVGLAAFACAACALAALAWRLRARKDVA